jgi:hypothetical protein
MAVDPVKADGLQDDAAMASDLPPERMRQVLDRIATDYYDRTDVLDHLARAVARELERGNGGGP